MEKRLAGRERSHCVRTRDIPRRTVSSIMTDNKVFQLYNFPMKSGKMFWLFRVPGDYYLITSAQSPFGLGKEGL